MTATTLALGGREREPSTPSAVWGETGATFDAIARGPAPEAEAEATRDTIINRELGGA